MPENEVLDTTKEVSVCYRSEDFSVYHPLQHTWVLWFDNPSAAGGRAKQDDWKASLKEVLYLFFKVTYTSTMHEFLFFHSCRLCM